MMLLLVVESLTEVTGIRLAFNSDLHPLATERTYL